MAAGYTVHLFVPNGDPNGVVIAERMNWTGRVTVVPRDQWTTVRNRDEFGLTGVYILFGYDEQRDEDLPSLYIGEADAVRHRLDSHVQRMAFWERAVVLTAGSHLNKAHVKWLEATLIARAKDAGRCVVTNPGGSNRPRLSESEEADMNAFLAEALAILPLVELRVFEPKGPVTTPGADSIHSKRPDFDTMIVPARQEGFQRVFLGEHAWHAVRIGRERLPYIQYLAVYQTQPVSAVTHLATVDHIEPYGVEGKFKLVFTGAPQSLDHAIPLGDAPQGSMQSVRYTSLDKLRRARTFADVL